WPPAPPAPFVDAGPVVPNGPWHGWWSPETQAPAEPPIHTGPGDAANGGKGGAANRGVANGGQLHGRTVNGSGAKGSGANGSGANGTATDGAAADGAGRDGYGEAARRGCVDHPARPPRNDSRDLPRRASDADIGAL